ncbi:oligosaccharide flippase family protein, partial [Acinetobacter baumannii]|nr:oligosaccharide flippase family protein [Acinetobacter baumannii]
MATGLAVLGKSVRLKVSRAWVRPLVRYGLPTALSSLPMLLSVRLDQAFLIREVSRSDLGNYAAAFAWSRAVIVATEVVLYMALPRVARLRGAERTAESEHLLRLAWMLTIVVAVPLALASPIAVPLLFGSGFRLAGTLALVLVPA